MLIHYYHILFQRIKIRLVAACTFIILCFILISACTPYAMETEFKPESVKSEVIKMLEDYHQAVNKNGLEAEFEFLDTSKAFFWIPPGFDKALDFSEVERILLENAPLAKGIQFHWEKLEVFPLDHKIANYHGVVSTHMTSDTGEAQQGKILESGTLIKRKDGWKLLSGQSIELKK